jgi:hypothetical protein
LCGFNLCTEKELTNNAACTLHSLSLNPSCALDATWRRIEAAAPGEAVWIEPPLSVNVEIRRTPDVVATWPADETLVVGRIVIPLLEQRKPRRIKSIVGPSAAAATAKRRSGLCYYGYGVELGFGITNNKVQGQTLQRVIVDLSASGRARHSVSSVYVACSRVRRCDHLRVLPLAPASRQKLLALEFDASLVRWWHAAKGGAGAGAVSGGVSSSSGDGATGLPSGGAGAAARARSSRKRAAPTRSSVAAISRRSARELTAALGRAAIVARRTFEGANVRTLDVGAGGNCFFLVLAHQLDGGLETSSAAAFTSTRQLIASFAQQHVASLVAQFGHLVVGAPLGTVLERLTQNGVWKDPALDFLLGPLAARCYCRVVRILQEATLMQSFAPSAMIVAAAADAAADAAALAAPPLDLFRSGDHFVSVLREA